MTFFNRLRHSNFARQVGILLKGSIVAQLITVAAAPILTRIYSPEAFGILAMFAAIISAISPGITGRYDMAAIVIKDEDEGRQLFTISVIFNFFLCILITLSLPFFSISSYATSTYSDLGWLIYLIPPTIFLTGFINSYKSWANRTEDYFAISWSLIYQNAAFSVLAILLLAMTHEKNGLVYSTVIATAATLIFLCLRYKNRLRLINFHSCKESLALARSYKDYPLFNATTSIINGFTSNLPVFYIAKFFGTTEVGLYALLIKVGALPLSALADAVSRVNLRKISALVNANTNPISYFTKITLALFCISLLPTILITLWGGPLFSLAFGPEWYTAGVLLTILMPALAVQFIVSTLSLSFLATGKLRLVSYWQALSFILSVVIFEIAGRNGDIYEFFWYYMLKDIVAYTVYYLILVYVLRKHWSQVHATR